MDAIPLSQLLRGIGERISQGRFTHVLTVNPLMLAEAGSDADLAEIFEEADFCVSESVGISLVARLKGLPIKERIPGIDLTLELCALAAQKHWPVALVGGRPGIAEKAGERLEYWKYWSNYILKCCLKSKIFQKRANLFFVL